MIEWEHVGEGVWRFSVPGGWLYKVTPNSQPDALAFVPDPEFYRKLDRDDDA